MINSSAINGTCLLDETFLTIMMPPALTILFIFAASLYSLALWTFCFHVKKKAPLNILMLNLCIRDLLFSLTYPIVITYYSNNNHWIFGNFMCKLQTFLIYFIILASIFFLTCICNYWCYMIVRPVHSQNRITKKRAIVLRVLIWLLAGGLMSPSFSRISVFEMDGQLHCMSFNQPNVHKQFHSSTIVLFLLSFVIPFVSLFVSTLLIHTKLANSTLTSQSQKGQRAIKMVIIVLCIFVICFLPINAMHLTLSIVDRSNCKNQQHLGVLYYAGVLTLYLNNVLDPIVYFYAGTKYRAKFISSIKGCTFCKSLPITISSTQSDRESKG
ncbi:hydroxycarboxylic acid receptor 3-like [Stegostoma tigrinum]|uniref:hydroxycarboxylic acid receptor 3-like n=1 Tax=Stegostoma tigrinum TaxID=3053191 RepID=UPI0028707E38|nr:hydroxycarboxylic acid receptor 3-like [Stegostoma tigrinum]